jgi:prepilin-type N-terminal cleavage/methylation domain-containing protein
MKLSGSLKNQKGFTLIELLVVIGILAVLLSITLIAINPARQFAQANNTKRRSDVSSILNAVNQYMADHKGVLPTGITTAEKEVSNSGANICTALVPQYIAALPVDPQIDDGAAITEAGCEGTYATGYTIMQDAANNRVTVKATTVELDDIISATR